MTEAEILAFAEKKADETLKLLRASYDDLHDRIHKVVTGLVGGAGAVGAYALGKLSSPDMMESVPLGLLAFTWFGIAVFLTIKGAKSRELSPGNGPENILKYYRARLNEMLTEERRGTDALSATREAELVLQQKRIRQYGGACVARAEALDATYVAIGFSLLVPVSAAGLLVYLR